MGKSGGFKSDTVRQVLGLCHCKFQPMHCPLPSLESPWSGVKMGKQGGSVEHEEPQVSPDRNVSRLTWRRTMQQIAKETLRFSSQPLPASGQCHGPATAPTASPGTNSRISWVFRLDIRTVKHKTQGLKEKVSWLTMWESLGSGETLILDRRELETRRGFGFLQQQCHCQTKNFDILNRSLSASASLDFFALT